MEKLVYASITSIDFRIQSFTKLMRSEGRRYLQSPTKAANRDIGVTGLS